MSVTESYRVWLSLAANKLALPFILLSAVFFTSTSYAVGDRQDYDIDDDGLIEINDVQDLLEIYYTGRSAAIYGEHVGCPNDVCKGYELTQDIHLDPNRPSHKFGGMVLFNHIFEGNFFTISNFNGNFGTDTALFKQLSNAVVRNLNFDNLNLISSGGSYVGAIATFSANSLILNCNVSGTIEGDHFVGGLVAIADNTTFVNSHFTGSLIQRGPYPIMGGLAGYSSDSIIFASSFTGVLPNNTADIDSTIGGLVGQSSTSNGIPGARIIASYVDANVFSDDVRGGFVDSRAVAVIRDSYTIMRDESGDIHRATLFTGSESGGSALNIIFSEECSNLVSGKACFNLGLFTGWSVYKDSNNKPLWAFLQDEAFPVFSSSTDFHDIDADGDFVINNFDAFPDIAEANVDTDADGSPDFFNDDCSIACQRTSGLTIDGFPTNKAAAIDDDLDSLPDEWHKSCDLECQKNSGLVLDEYLNDHDNDGIPDPEDTDDNNDGIEDADKNGNGLIEVYTLEDLNNMRGEELVHIGCPSTIYKGLSANLCRGYELMNDLDFDTNGDGEMNELDTYWNDQRGWIPISGSSTSSYFKSVFDGRGHVIYNLHVNRPLEEASGLFGHVAGARIMRLGLTGNLMQVTGSSLVGGLVGNAINSEIIATYSKGEIQSHQGGSNAGTGGLVGAMSDSYVFASFSTGAVYSNKDNAGGLVGWADEQSTISASYATGNVSSLGQYGGGLVGKVEAGSILYSYSVGAVEGSEFLGGLAGEAEQVVHSYWLASSSLAGQGMEATQNELMCHTFADDTACRSDVYVGWREYLSQSGVEWEFGNSRDFPSLNTDGYNYVDSDGDLVIDVLDAFPLHAEVALDQDHDEIPDRWNSGCDEFCRKSSAYRLDDLIVIEDTPRVDSKGEANNHSGGTISLQTLFMISCISAFLLFNRKYFVNYGISVRYSG